MPKKISDSAKAMQEQIYLMYRKAQNKVMETDRVGKIHVSDLNSPCIRKVYYSKTAERRELNTDDMKSMFFGQMLHKLVKVADEDLNEVTLAYDYVKKEAVDIGKLRKKLDPDDPKWYDIIVGTIDDLVQNPEKEWIICDKKTTGSIDWFKKSRTANESHINQINKYHALLKYCRDIEAKHGCVIYISSTMTKDNYDKPIITTFDLSNPEDTMKDMIEKAKKIKESMLKEKKPERTICFLCDGMCPHATFCFDDD